MGLVLTLYNTILTFNNPQGEECRTFWPWTFWPGRFGQDVLATDVLATYSEKMDVLAKYIIYVLIIDIKATNIFNLLI